MDAKIAEVLVQSPPGISEDRVRGIIEGMGVERAENVSVSDILAILWNLPPKAPTAVDNDEWRARNDYMDSLYEEIEKHRK